MQCYNCCTLHAFDKKNPNVAQGLKFLSVRQGNRRKNEEHRRETQEKSRKNLKVETLISYFKIYSLNVNVCFP